MIKQTLSTGVFDQVSLQVGEHVEDLPVGDAPVQILRVKPLPLALAFPQGGQVHHVPPLRADQPAGAEQVPGGEQRQQLHQHILGEVANGCHHRPTALRDGKSPGTGSAELVEISGVLSSY